MPSTEDAVRIAQVTDTRIEWMMFGTGYMHEEQAAVGTGIAKDYSDVFSKTPRGDFSHADSTTKPNSVHAWESPDELDPEHYAFVPRYDVHVSAGNGSMVYEANEQERPQSFRREYLQQKGLKEANLMCLKATGDSMEPTITDGATLLVNQAENTVQDGKVFVIRFGSEIRVKRLYLRPDGGMTIQSDNPSFPDVDVTPDQMEHVAIIGRVVWQAGDL
jgi:phage repressor protein C with HTH and peptisase S24 domain